MNAFTRLVLALGFCLPALAGADDVGYIDCRDHSEITQVFGKADKTSQIVTSLPCGERFTILVNGAVFSRIQTKDGKGGYVYSYLISLDYSATSVQQVTSSQTPAHAQAAPAQPAPSQPVQPQPAAPPTVQPVRADSKVEGNMTPLTNRNVVDMLRMRLAPEIVLAKIKSSACNFDTSPPALQELKTAGVPDNVILAMVDAPVAPKIGGPTPDPPSPSVNKQPVSSEQASQAIGTKAQPKSIPAGAKVYIESSGGFENYLSAAFLKKDTPVTVVTKREEADFLIVVVTGGVEGTVGRAAVNAATCVLTFYGCGDTGARNSASMRLIDPKTQEVVYSYSVKKDGSNQQSAAEACAKHLKHFIKGTGK